MPAVDPVILQLRAEVDDYNRKVASATSMTEQRLAKIEAAGFKMGSGIRTAFGTVATAATGFVAALGVSALIQATKAGLDYAASLGETAQSLGVTTQFLQEFRFAATQSGSSLETADDALGKFSITLGKAFEGNKQAAESLTGLGLSLRELKDSSDTGRFELVADAIAKIKDPAQQSAAAVAIFGRGAREIIPTLQAGASGFREQAEAARAYGIVLSDKQIQDADKTADKLDALSMAFRAKIGGAVADNVAAIDTLINALARVVTWAGKAVSALNYFRLQSKVNAAQERANLADNAAKGWFVSPKQREQAMRESLSAKQEISELRQQQIDAVKGARGIVDPGSTKAGTRPNIPAADAGGALTPVKSGSKGPKGKSAEELQNEQNAITRRYNDDLRAIQVERLRDELDIATDADARREILRQLDDEEYKARLEAINNEKDYSASQKTALIKELNARFGRSPPGTGDDIVVTGDASPLGRARRLEALRQKEREAADLADATFQVQSDALHDQYDLADTLAKRRDVAEQILDIDYRHKRAALDAIIASETASDAEKKRAKVLLDGLDAAKKADAKKTDRDNEGPLRRYLHEFDDPATEVEQAVVDKLRSIDDAITKGVTDTLGIDDPFLSRLIQIFLEQNILKPLYEAFSDTEGGGGGGGLFGAIGGLLGGRGGGFNPILSLFGRASGGYVGPNQTVRVNEQRGGMELLRMGSQGGTVIPLGQVNQDAARPSASAPGVALIRLSLSDDIDARIVNVSGPVAVEVLRAGAPGIVDAAEAQTLSNANRFRI